MTLDGRLVAMFLVGLAGCELGTVVPYDTGAEDTAADDGSAGDDDDDDDDNNSGPFYADVKPILAEYCTSCHGTPLAGGAPFALDTFALASERSGRIVARAVDGAPSAMPPSGLALSDEEAEILVAWDEAGAPRK